MPQRLVGDLVVSPELALVDPDLAEIARALLPDHAPSIAAAAAARPDTAATGAQATPDATAAAITVESKPEEALPAGMGVRRRIALWVALPVAFVAGVLAQVGLREIGRNWTGGGGSAAAGAQVPEKTTASPNRVNRKRETLRVTSPRAPTNQARKQSIHRPAPRRPTHASGRPRRRGGSLRPRLVNHPRRERPTNVLGVVVTSTATAVRLTWARPGSSHHVRILRTLGRGRSRPTVVYQGRGTIFVDRHVRSGRMYRYVLQNYDRRGRASTGVTTVVVVQPR